MDGDGWACLGAVTMTSIRSRRQLPPRRLGRPSLRCQDHVLEMKYLIRMQTQPCSSD